MNIHLYPESGHIHPYPTGEDIVDPAQPPFRVWIPEKPVVVLGYSQEAEKELNLTAVEAEEIPVYKRKSGGGAVLLSPGCVCVLLRLSVKRGVGIREHFAAANGILQTALREEHGIDLELRGVSDLAWRERKVAGSSLHLPRHCGVYLASLLVNTDLSQWDRFLAHPSREPDYRKRRTHAEFACNLNEIPGLESLTAERVMGILVEKLAGIVL